MRLQRISGGAPVATTDVGVGEDGRTPAAAELLGSWSATRWQYVSRARPGTAVDVVCDLGGTVTLSLSADSYVLTWDVPGRGSRSGGGAMTVDRDRLELRPPGTAESEIVIYRLAAATLSLSADGSAWDFGSNGEEAAEFFAVLVRL